MYEIRFVHQGVTFQTAGGTLSGVCAAAGFPLDLVCGGEGRCGKCRVEICRRDGVRTRVLACQTQVEEDLAVYLEDRQISRAAKVLTAGRSCREAVLRPSVSKRCFSRRELEGGHPPRCGLPVLRRVAALMADRSVDRITFTCCRGEAVAAEAGDTTGRLFGGAVDIGTTTLAFYLYDLNTGRCVYTGASLNPQTVCGADVAARIAHALEGGLEELRRQVLSGIGALIEEAERQVPGAREGLCHLVLCGNSAMQHLALGLSPSGLSSAPFTGVTLDPVRCTGEEAGIDMAPGGVVDFLPLLGGFVGADTAALLTALPEDAEDCMAVDLGTNGEIALRVDGQWRVSSTACGPALEGGCIDCGMRGGPGAIEHIRNGKAEVSGGGRMLGLCGSGIVDAVAELLRRGILDRTGAMRTAREYQAEHPGSDLADCLGQTEEGVAAFFFARGGHPVYLSQKDVRQVQLAKAAIRAGCRTLLADAGRERVGTLYLAGAFGSFIDVDNACAIGLLPPAERICPLGNGAGLGARLCLLDREAMERCFALPACTRHVELAGDPRFAGSFLEELDFPQPVDTSVSDR